MLPTMGRASRSAGAQSRGSQGSIPQYLRRILKWQQMDVEYCFWQMLHLCINPRLVYQHTKYHRQTKQQWARDDPAFVVISCMFLAISGTAYCIAYGHNLAEAGVTLFSVIFIDFVLLGCIIATACWALCNQYLTVSQESADHHRMVPSQTVPSGSSSGEQKVEWLYAFDVHCNAYFPVFILLHVVQYFLSPLLLAPGSVLAVLLSNGLFLTAFTYYHYLNFLGYNALPFLQNTTLLLLPVGVLFIFAPLLVLSGFNPTRFVLGYYFH